MTARVRRIAPARQRTVRSEVKCCARISTLTAGDRDWRTKRYAYRGGDPLACVRWACVEVDGVALCAQHAGERALAILLGEAAP
jgi:hypothetical protein